MALRPRSHAVLACSYDFKLPFQVQSLISLANASVAAIHMFLFAPSSFEYRTLSQPSCPLDQRNIQFVMVILLVE